MNTELKRLRYPVVPAYIAERPVMLSLAPTDLWDHGGRPVLEGRSGKFDVAASDYRSCKYTDARAGANFPMNVAAFRQWNRNKQSALRLFKAVLLCMQKRRSSMKGNREIRCASHAIKCAPLFWMLQVPSADRWDAIIPEELAAAVKLAPALVLLLDQMALAQEFSDVAIDAASAYRFADSHRLLIGGREVCPAPQAEIESVLHTLTAEVEGELEHVPWADDIARVGVAVQMIEYAAFVYEAARLFLEKRYLGTRKSTIRNSRKSRYSHPFAGFAVMCSEATEPFNEPVAKYLEGFVQFDITGSLELKTHFEAMRACTTGNNFGTSVSTLKSALLACFKLMNMHLSYRGPEKEVEERDLELLFGRFGE